MRITRPPKNEWRERHSERKNDKQMTREAHYNKKMTRGQVKDILLRGP